MSDVLALDVTALEQVDIHHNFVARERWDDVDLFVGYRRELIKEGIFELPLNLKRSHFSYAHTDEDVDRLLEGTEAAVTRFLEARA